MVGVKTKKNSLVGFFSAFGKTETETAKQEIANLAKSEISINSKFRLAENEYLFQDLETCLQIFSAKSEAACRVARYLANYDLKQKSSGNDSLCFCYPTCSAYTAALKLAAGVQMNDRGEISDEFLKILTDDFIEKHSYSNWHSDWMQDREAPLWQIEICINGERLDAQVGNAVQVAIIASVWSAMNAECHTKITKA